MELSGIPCPGAKREVIGPSIPATDFTVASNLIKTPGNDKAVCGMLRGRIWRQEKNRSRLLRSLGRDKGGARGPCVAGGLERADYSTPRADRDTTPGERDRLQAAQIIRPKLRPRREHRSPHRLGLWRQSA